MRFSPPRTLVFHEDNAMRFPGRKLSVVLRRNESKDEQSGGIEYTGYDIFWPSGARVQGLAFDRFCKIGVRYILGRDKPAVAELDAYFVPLAGRQELPPRVPGSRVRVLSLERDGPRLTVCLSDETPTDIVFDLEQDEEPVLKWLGARAIADRARQWFGFYALQAASVGAAGAGRPARQRPSAFVPAPRSEQNGMIVVP
jgi:hypothetical protein